ncbi:MAG TPA: tetratricopeptide repeat protein [Oceanipulchritudo sp.]|nr:tetratricopeptide repeat protein [Oceanipulchritudo sp.]
MNQKYTLILTLVLLAASPLAAKIFPLSENAWNNPDFVKRFIGSYGFDTSVTPSITSEEQALFEAIAPLIDSDPPAAIAQLKEAIGPDSSAALSYTVGNLYLQSGEIPEARRYYESAIKAFPNFLRAYKNLGILHIQEGNYEVAVEMLLKTIQLGGQSADVYGLIGYSYLNLGNSVSALRAYEQALFFAPESRDWRMGKVQALSNLGRYEDAIALIDQLMEAFPMQDDLLLLQANAFIARGEPENAAAALEILRGRGKAKPSALMLLGDIYLNFQQADLALSSYRGVAEDASLTPERALRVARRLAASGAWPEVDGFLSIVQARQVGESPVSESDRIEFLNLQAQSDLSQNRTAAAAEKLAEVVSLDPLNGRALLLLANYHWDQGDIERAEIYYERAAKVDEVAPDALIQHGRMLVSIREFRKAVRFLERAQQIRPQTHVGQFLEKVASAASATGR